MPPTSDSTLGPPDDSGPHPAAGSRTVVVSLAEGARERLVFALSATGAVSVMRGDATGFDFDAVLPGPDGRPVSRAEPLPWALGLQAAHEQSALSVWVATGTGAPPPTIAEPVFAPVADAEAAAGGAPAHHDPAPTDASGHAPAHHDLAPTDASGHAPTNGDPTDASGHAPTAGEPVSTHAEPVPPGATGEPPCRPDRRRGRRWRVAVAALGLIVLTAIAVVVAVPNLNPHALGDSLKSLVGLPGHPGCNVVNCTRPGQPPRLGPVPGLRKAAERGVAELMSSASASPVSRDPATGLWGNRTKPAWWQSALALGTVVRYALVTRTTDPRFQQVILSTYRLNVRKPGTHMPLNFGNQFLDDTGWWGLTWLDAARYEASVLHDNANARRFLTIAEWDADYIATRPRTCTGGLAWRLGAPPDTITSAEFVTLAAQLYTLRSRPGLFHDDARASHWLADASASLNWLESSGLVNLRTGAVKDTFDKACRPAGGALTYTEGEMAAALTQMGAALHEPSYFAQARRFLAYTMNPRHGMMHAGVVQEFCESMRNQCVSIEDFNVSVFKGMFVQAVADYELATGDAVYRRFLRRQALAIIHHSVSDATGVRTSCQTARDCQFGFYWARAIDPGRAGVPVTVATQISALRALTAAIAA